MCSYGALDDVTVIKPLKKIGELSGFTMYTVTVLQSCKYASISSNT